MLFSDVADMFNQEAFDYAKMVTNLHGGRGGIFCVGRGRCFYRSEIWRGAFAQQLNVPKVQRHRTG